MKFNQTLTYDGVELIDYACFFDGSDSFRIPEKMVDTYEIPGRNGDLSVSQERYSNIDISYYCFIRENFRKNYIELVNRLSSAKGYARLESSEEPDVYRLAMFNNDIQPDLYQGDQGMFYLRFNCKPQKYLKSGEIPVTIDSSTTLINPTRMPARPLILCSGTGDITINDTTITLDANTSVTYIDCDLQDAYEGTINRNPNISLTNGFPKLEEVNEISVSGMTVQLIPRWWRL